MEVKDIFGLRKQGKNVILDIEVEGAENVRKACPDALSFYIIPPSAAELVRRIEGRGTESAQQIERRLNKAVNEADVVPSYHYQIINDSFDGKGWGLQDNGKEIGRYKTLKAAKAAAEMVLGGSS
mgnify:CR=1 FL=1